jgi:group I intron endonuclease
MYKLYQITNTINGKSYVGITKLSLAKRWEIHLGAAKNPKYPIQHAIQKYGPEFFTIILLEENVDRKYISGLEEPTIQRLQTHITQNGYNVAKGGYGGDLGPAASKKRSETIKNFSPEKQQQNRARLRARNLGKSKDNDPGRLAQSEKIKGNKFRAGIPHDEGSKLKIANSNRGKIRSDIARQNYRKAAKLRGCLQFHGKKVCCLCCQREWDLGNFTQHVKRNSK